MLWARMGFLMKRSIDSVELYDYDLQWKLWMATGLESVNLALASFCESNDISRDVGREHMRKRSVRKR